MKTWIETAKRLREAADRAREDMNEGMASIYADGASLNEVAALFGMTVGDAAGVLRSCGVHVRRGKAHMANSPGLRRLAVEAILAERRGLSVDEIARETGTTIKNVARILSDPPLSAHIAADYASGMASEDVAGKYGVSRQRVHQVRQEWEVLTHTEVVRSAFDIEEATALYLEGCSRRGLRQRNSRRSTASQSSA